MMVLRIKEQETRLTLQEHDGDDDDNDHDENWVFDIVLYFLISFVYVLDLFWYNLYCIQNN